VIDPMMSDRPDDGRQPNTFQTACLHEPETPEPLNSQDAWLFDDYDHVVLEARMPLFFFDYRGNHGCLERDEEGIEFASLEAAYKDAHHAAIDMHADACRQGKSLADHSFEIRDESGLTLLVLPFNEALSGKR
jgi:Domain of unknown function (DUF6894)